MERMRLQTFVLASVHFSEKDKKKIDTPKKLMPFDWDNEEVTVIPPQPTEKDFKGMDNISVGFKRQ